MIAPAPPAHGGGFTPKDLAWILTHSPVETLVLRPAPDDAEPVRQRRRRARERSGQASSSYRIRVSSRPSQA